MNSRTFRTDERAFEVQSDDSIATANGTSRCNGGLQALARIGDQSRKTARCAKPAVSARNSRDGRDIVRELDALRASGRLERSLRGRVQIFTVR